MSRTVLVTGGTRGIGFAIAEEFASDHNVAVVWNSTPPQQMSDGVQTLQADLTKVGNCKVVVDEVIAHFGGLGCEPNSYG